MVMNSAEDPFIMNLKRCAHDALQHPPDSCADQQLIQHIMGTMIDSLRDEGKFQNFDETRQLVYVSTHDTTLVRGSRSVRVFFLF